MKKISRFTGTAIALSGRNIDTDQIIPARFLKKNRMLTGGYGPYLFHDLRHGTDGKIRPDFILTQPVSVEASILIADQNFGCGSSREGAVYALVDHGFRAVLAPSFGDIFYTNCLKNGLLPIRLDEKVIANLMEQLHHNEATRTVQVDLEHQQVQWELPGSAELVSHEFLIDSFWRECLLKGVDEVELTLSKLDKIEAFEAGYLQQFPWNNGPLCRHDALNSSGVDKHVG